jgi:hypothetical protein
MAPLEFQTGEVSHGAENGLVRPSNRHPADTQDRDPESSFDYLLREPRHARRLRRTLHIVAGFVALSALVCVLHGCA